MPSGRYQVRCRRTDQKDTNSRAGHELRWLGLAGVTTEPPDYRNVSLLYVHSVATDKIGQQASRKINAVVQRKLPVWSSTGWSAPVAMQPDLGSLRCGTGGLRWRIAG